MNPQNKSGPHVKSLREAPSRKRKHLNGITTVTRIQEHKVRLRVEPPAMLLKCPSSLLESPALHRHSRTSQSQTPTSSLSSALCLFKTLCYLPWFSQILQSFPPMLLLHQSMLWLAQTELSQGSWQHKVRREAAGSFIPRLPATDSGSSKIL